MKSHRRRILAALVTCGLGVGLVLLVITYVGEMPQVSAKVALAPLAPQAADLEVGKEGPDSTLTGQVLTYTISITNRTGAPINDVIITDTWATNEGGEAGTPAEFNGNYWGSALGLVRAFTYTVFTEEEKSGLAYWELDPLPAGFQGTLEFTVSIPTDLQPLHTDRERTDIGPSSLGNSVAITGSVASVGESDQVITAILGPVFKLEKFATTEPGVGPRPGRLITYALRLDNLERLDSIPATGIVIWEVLPDELIYEDGWSQAPLADGTTEPEFDPVSRHITWTLAPEFGLNPGEATTVTFVTRLSTTQEWKINIDNDTDSCMAISQELAKPVECWERVRVQTLSIFDKTYVTEPSNLSIGQTYPNRYVTYTVHLFNPLSQTVASNLWITDVMPETWDFITMVDGPPPAWPSGEITNTVAWHWPGEALQPGEVISLTFLAHIGPDTPVKAAVWCYVDYYNSLAASADEFPIVYGYGRPFKSENGLAKLRVVEQISLDKDVTPSAQVAGEIVTYTASLENVGDRMVSGIVFTDTLPEFFRFDSMVGDPQPTNSPTRTIVWDIGALDAGETYQLVFRAIADGVWQEKYYNHIDAYSPETTFCAQDKARVEVLSPIVHNKEADPSLISGDWVVQGEWFEYNVEYWNQSRSFAYLLDMFWDMLYDGFEVNGAQLYTTDADGLPLTLLTDKQNSWLHTFQVDTPGYGSGTVWCNALIIDEDGLKPNVNRQLEQVEGTFGVHVSEPVSGLEDWTYNGEDTASMLFKPHVDLRQIVYPKKTGLGGTVEVTLTLHNNIRNHNGATERAVEDITVTYQLPSDFTFLEMLPLDPAPTTQTDEELVWTAIDLGSGEGAQTHLRFRIRAPLEETGLPARGYASALPADPSICIPQSEAKYYVVKGVEVVKKPYPDAVGPFGVVEYDLQLINLSTAPVTDLTITDTLPAGFEYLSIVPGYGSPEPDSTSPLVWRNLSIAASPMSGFPRALRIRYQARASGLFGAYYNKVDGVSASTYVTYSDTYWDDVEVAVLPGVALYKSVWPEQTQAGQTVVYTVTVDNRSGQDIAGVRITDTLPPGFSYLERLSGGEPITTTPKIVWTVSNLANQQKAQWVFSARIDDAIVTDDYCNRASATAHEAGNPSAPVTIPDTDLTACVAVTGLPNIQRSKTVSPSTVQAGSLVTYTLTLYNDSEAPQTVHLTDTLPLALTYADVVAPTPGPDLTSPVVWRGLTLGVSETVTLTFRAQVDLYTHSGTYYNQLDVETAEARLPSAVLLAPLQVEEIPRFDLQVTKSDGLTNVEQGETVEYTIVYTNANAAGLTLNNVVLTDTFGPLPHVGPGALTSGWQQVTADQYTFYVGDVGPGASGSVTFSLQLATSIPDDILFITNTVEIGHDTSALAFETDSGNNRDTDQDFLSEQVIPFDLQVSKSDGLETAREGDTLEYTITYTNANVTGLTLTNVVLTDTFGPSPPHATPTGLSGGWQQAAPDQYTYAVGALGPNESGSATFRLQLGTSIPTQIERVTNTVEIGHDTAVLAVETDPGNNQDTDQDVLDRQEIPRYDLQVSKSDGVTSVDAGDILLYTIIYTNANNADLTLTDVVLTDTFGPAPPYADPTGLGGGWQQVAPDQYTYYVGDLSPNESGSATFGLQLATSIPAQVQVVSNTVEIGHDTAEQALETNPSNDRFTDLDVLGGPDLLPGALEISPTNPQPGQPITFSVTVRNQGKDATQNVAGAGWFVVELYLKGSSFTPAGPPVDVFDHAGGWWSDASRTEERLPYMCVPAGLSAGGEDLCTFAITDVVNADDYHVYVQVDVSFDDQIGEPWGHDYGVVREAIESNNIAAYGIIRVGGSKVYLPIITKNH